MAASVAGDMRDRLYALALPLYLTRVDGQPALATGGTLQPGLVDPVHPWLGFAPACPPECLGDPAFLSAHGLRYAYVAGAMANGIGSVEIVVAMGESGMLGFFGAGGLGLDRVEAAIDKVQQALGNRPYGFNLLHAPNEPDHEMATVELYLRKGVHLVEAAAYLDLTLPLVRYRMAGIHRGPDGFAVAPNRVVAKVSRVEVAAKFFAPPPPQMLAELVRRGFLTEDQALLAATLPVAQDLTAEADSGGHTDNRPAITLLPTMLALRDRLQAQYGYAERLRVGAAGGIATPAGVAAAFTMGASYVVTGSINQACVESGSSDTVRRMLAGAQQADTAMAPAGDMFEMGVKVQVLKRGTMFAMRAQKLYELYRACDSLEAIPVAEREKLEREVFKRPLAEIWEETRAYFAVRDPAQNERALRDPKHQLALVCRWYLGHASRWANAGDATRQVDYQIWCGPAMGAFNEWAKGSFLERPEERRVTTVALNLLVGAAALTRLATLRTQGLIPDPLLSAPHVMAPPALAACLH
jgi:trans-AT polyketide synthase/acyltransferase/oxidoreductase domain-containing protein